MSFERFPEAAFKTYKVGGVEFFMDSYFQGLPFNIIGHILGQLDIGTCLSAQLTCKHFYNLIAQRKHSLIHTLKDPKKALLQKMTTPFLKEMFFHPDTVISAYFAFSHIDLREEDPLFIPESIEIFERLVQDHPKTHSFLTRIFIQLDPIKNYKNVRLASRFIKKSPEMQSVLREIVDRCPIKIKEAPSYCKTKEKCEEAGPSLMALKLLNLAGEKTAQRQTRELNQ